MREELQNLISNFPDGLKPNALALVRDLDVWLDVFAKHYGLKTKTQQDALQKYHLVLMSCWHGLLDAAPRDSDGKIDTHEALTYQHMLALEAAARTGAVFIQRMRYGLGLLPARPGADVAAIQEAALAKLTKQSEAMATLQGADRGRIQLNVTPHEACSIASGLLLALRHPATQNLEVGGLCRTFVQHICDALGKAGLSAGIELIATQMEEFGTGSDALCEREAV